MAGKRSILIEVLGDYRNFVRGSKQGEAAAGGLVDKIEAVGKALALAYSAKAVVTWGVQAARSAGDVAEAQNKVTVVFDDQAEAIKNWSKTSATALGMSQKDALDAAANFAIFGKSAGLVGEEMADFSTDLVSLSADLASFHNTSPEDAILAIGAALRGESEPIRRYGVLLNDATLKQRAMEMGIYDGNGALSTQTRVLAAQAEILAQTTDAQGDFNRTKDGAANQARILAAQYKDMQATIGQALLPVLAQVVGVASAVFSWFNNLDGATRSYIVTVGIIAAALYVGVAAFGAITAAVTAFGVSASAAVPWLAAIGVTIVAIGAVINTFADKESAAEKATKKFNESTREAAAGVDIQRLALLSAADAADEYAESVYAGVEADMRKWVTEHERAVEVMQSVGISMDDVAAAATDSTKAQALLAKVQAYGNETGLAAWQNGMAMNDVIEEQWKGYRELVGQLEAAAQASEETTAKNVNLARSGDLVAIAYLKATGQLARLGPDGMEAAERALDLAAASERAAAEGEALATVADEEANALDGLTISLNSAEAGADRASIANENVRKSMAAADLAASDLKKAIDAIFQPYMNMEDATQAVIEGTAALTQSLKDNGATLDMNTEKGRANRDQVQAQVESILSYATASVAAGDTNEEAADKVAFLTDGLRSQLIAAGLAEEEVDNYLATLGLTPENVETTIELAEADARKRELEGLLDQLDGIDDGARAEIQADIDSGAFSAAETKLRALGATTTKKFIVSVSGGGTIEVTPRYAGGYRVYAYAHGGYPPANTPVMWGETAGAEIAEFPSGTRIYNPGESRQIMQADRRSGGGDTYVIQHVAGSVVTERQLNDQVASGIRTANRRQRLDTLAARRVPV